MESGGGAYGAAKAGGTFDLWHCLQQPQVIARIFSAVFALIVFSCIIGEGYTNQKSSPHLSCIFNHSEDACRYGIGIGVVAFLACIFFFMVDIYFLQISSATDHKYLVMADLGFSAWDPHYFYLPSAVTSVPWCDCSS
uniref:MARVEL domain-containing protein n=1 Tax=Pseudonaja textilis TaxID=8673 RepID=A0A670XR44_PSETE